MTKFYKTTYPDTLAASIDEIVTQGGTWAELFTECQKHAIRLGRKPYTIGQIKSHIIWRKGEDSRYLGRYEVTAAGVEKVR